MTEVKTFDVQCSGCKVTNRAYVDDIKAGRPIICYGCGKAVPLAAKGLTAKLKVARAKAKVMARKVIKRLVKR